MLVLLWDSFERFLLSRLDTIVKTESLAGGNARRSTAAPQFRCLLKADVLKAKASARRIWKWVSVEKRCISTCSVLGEETESWCDYRDGNVGCRGSTPRPYSSSYASGIFLISLPAFLAREPLENTGMSPQRFFTKKHAYLHHCASFVLYTFSREIEDGHIDTKLVFSLLCSLDTDYIF